MLARCPRTKQRAVGRVSSQLGALIRRSTPNSPVLLPIWREVIGDLDLRPVLPRELKGWGGFQGPLRVIERAAPALGLKGRRELRPAPPLVSKPPPGAPQHDHHHPGLLRRAIDVHVGAPPPRDHAQELHRSSVPGLITPQTKRGPPRSGVLL